MRFFYILAGAAGALFCIACSGEAGVIDGSSPRAAATRIVSLDYCADQYVLKFAQRENILALSRDAEADYSYLKKAARGLPKVSARAEDILLLRPDLVVRTYGGGPNIERFLERAGVPVLQIGFANDLAGVKDVILETSAELGAETAGQAVVRDMNARIEALREHGGARSVLYLSSKGAVAGTQTLIDDLFAVAGLQNFQRDPGWRSLPLERMAYEKPDVMALSFFETSDLVSDIWTPVRHPVAQRRIKEATLVRLSGAWTSCGAWFNLDAAEALAQTREESAQTKP